jgi:hypothetical protein
MAVSPVLADLLAPVTLATRADEAGRTAVSKFYEISDNLPLLRRPLRPGHTGR